MDAIYNIDWNRFRKMFVAGIRRRTKYLVLLKAFARPITNLHLTFLQFREKALYQVSHDGSIVKLEKVMNDHFDSSQRRIYISNAVRIDALRVYSIPAQKEIAINSQNKPVAVRTSNDNGNGSADFIVHLPADIQPGTETQLEGLIIRIKAQLNYYKLFDKKYKLEWIN